MKEHPAFKWFQVISTFTSLLVSIVALVLAMRADERSAVRFSQQLNQSDRIAKANVKPLLSFYAFNYIDKKGIILINRGSGTAVIDSVTFLKDDIKKDNPEDLFDLGSDVVWSDYFHFGSGKTYVKAGEEINLVLLTKATLEKSIFDTRRVMKILTAFKTQRDNIKIKVAYKDVLDNQQEPVKFN